MSKWVTVAEAVKATGKTDRTIRRWAADNKVPSKRDGQRLLIDISGVAVKHSIDIGANIDAASVAIDKSRIVQLEAEAVMLRDMIETLKSHNEDWTRQSAALTQIINTQQKLIEDTTTRRPRWQFWRKE